MNSTPSYGTPAYDDGYLDGVFSRNAEVVELTARVADLETQLAGAPS